MKIQKKTSIKMMIIGNLICYKHQKKINLRNAIWMISQFTELVTLFLAASQDPFCINMILWFKPTQNAMNGTLIPSEFSILITSVLYIVGDSQMCSFVLTYAKVRLNFDKQ